MYSLGQLLCVAGATLLAGVLGGCELALWHRRACLRDRSRDAADLAKQRIAGTA